MAGGDFASKAPQPALSDPLDFAMPELRMLDQNLRCQVCQDFFRTPVMITQCSHSFCSECIRRHLGFKHQLQQYSPRCPICNVDTNEMALRPNRVLEDLVASYVPTLRPWLLKASTAEMRSASGEEGVVDTPGASRPDADAGGVSRKRAAKQSPDRATLPLTSTPSNQSSTEDASSHTSKRPRTSRKLSGVAASESDVQHARVRDTVDGSADEALRGSAEPSSPASSPQGGASSGTSLGITPGQGMSATVDAKDPTDGRDLQECPVCQHFFHPSKMNSHLDRCLNAAEKCQALRSSSRGSSMTKKPKVTYKVLKDKALRNLLKECGLPTEGTRQQCIRRHEEFILLYNSQCDSETPMSARSIAREVERRERRKAQASMTMRTDALLAYDGQSNADQIASAQKEYATKNKDEFSRLKAAARKTRRKGAKRKPGNSLQATPTAGARKNCDEAQTIPPTPPGAGAEDSQAMNDVDWAAVDSAASEAVSPVLM